jgi:PAS domain S-box-containing protein
MDQLDDKKSNVAPYGNLPILLTDRSQCRECYRCVRVCPVKAIRICEDVTEVDPQRCILCGRCLRECPQNARSVRNDISRARHLIESPGKVAASIDPAFAALLLKWQRERLPSALRQLGFDYVAEAAIGAAAVAAEVARQATADNHSDGRAPHICACCPSVVRYVEQYHPDQVERLLPIISPMIAHARHIRNQQADEISVVYIGPCLAEKGEAARDELKDEIQCVLTFDELFQWLADERIDLASCEESDFCEQPSSVSRIFGLEGGCLRTAGWRTDLLDRDVVAISGFDEVSAMLGDHPVKDGPRVIEPLLCSGGCINGPAMPNEPGRFSRRSKVLQYASEGVSEPTPIAQEPDSLKTTFSPAPGSVDQPFGPREVRKVLKQIGHGQEENQLDCGACGYSTCREKAIAVLRGLADPNTCIPRMKQLAQRRTDRIMETSPNGIVIVDRQFNIVHMNRAFRHFFSAGESLIGRPISNLIDPAPFEAVLARKNDAPPERDEPFETTQEYKRFDLITYQIHYRLSEEDHLVGIFVNITNSRLNQQRLDRVRAAAVLQARELLQHQLDMTQTIARCLGESTARGEDLVERLILLAEDSSPQPIGLTKDDY